MAKPSTSNDVPVRVDTKPATEPKPKIVLAKPVTKDAEAPEAAKPNPMRIRKIVF